jgi:hypothetical protein
METASFGPAGTRAWAAAGAHRRQFGPCPSAASAPPRAERVGGTFGVKFVCLAAKYPVLQRQIAIDDRHNHGKNHRRQLQRGRRCGRLIQRQRVRHGKGPKQTYLARWYCIHFGIGAAGMECGLGRCSFYLREYFGPQRHRQALFQVSLEAVEVSRAQISLSFSHGNSALGQGL